MGGLGIRYGGLGMRYGWVGHKVWVGWAGGSEQYEGEYGGWVGSGGMGAEMTPFGRNVEYPDHRQYKGERITLCRRWGD